MWPSWPRTNALEKVERLGKLERIGGFKITFASVEDVGNGQMSYSLIILTTSYSLIMLT